MANVHYCFLTAEKVESAVQSLREELGEQHWHFLAYFSCTMIFKAIKMMLNQPRGCHTFSIDGATP
ncbi:conserved hypothetical protein, partial [Ricinus communis]